MNASAREALPGWIALLAVAAVAWRMTLADAAMMGDAPGTMGMPFVPFMAMWVPMMAAMMLPAITPVATLWAGSISRKPRSVEGVVRLMLFAAGYVAVWAGAGVLAYAMMRPVEIGAEAGLYSPRAAAVTVLIVAGLYQLSPLREDCLSKCRSPMSVLTVVTAGPVLLRDLRAGALHGAWCLACCWSLMAILALLGLMNVTAMVVLAVFVFAEKTSRFGVAAGRLAGLLMLMAAALTAVSA